MAEKPAPKINTVTLRQIGAALSEAHDIPKKQAAAVLEDLVTMITKHLKKGDKIRIGGLGRAAGTQASGAHGPQPGDRRSHQDQGIEEGCLPRRQGAEGIRLSDLRSRFASHARLLRAAAGHRRAVFLRRAIARPTPRAHQSVAICAP